MTEAGSIVRERVVEADAPAGRLDLAVSEAAQISRALAQRLIAAGEALVEGRTGRPGDRLRGGERLLVRVPPPAQPELRPEPLALVAVYEDDELLIVDKPAGLVVHPGAGHATGTLVHGLLGRAAAGEGELARGPDGEWPGIVHRLDKDTSGLLMVAKTDSARLSLRRQLAARSVSKEYVALVRGAPRSTRGRIEAPIARDARDRQRMSVQAGGRDSVTEYEVIGSASGYSLLSVRPLTGRTHQIRAHLAFVRLPIAGDLRYGGGEGPGGLRRQFLHAARLAVDRPADGARLTAWSELPEDLRTSLAAVASISTEALPTGHGATLAEAA